MWVSEQLRLGDGFDNRQCIPIQHSSVVLPAFPRLDYWVNEQKAYDGDRTRNLGIRGPTRCPIAPQRHSTNVVEFGRSNLHALLTLAFDFC